MYIITTAFKNIIRCIKRYAISGVLLLIAVVAGVIVCSVYQNCGRLIEEARNEYEGRLDIYKQTDNNITRRLTPADINNISQAKSLNTPYIRRRYFILDSTDGIGTYLYAYNAETIKTIISADCIEGSIPQADDEILAIDQSAKIGSEVTITHGDVGCVYKISGKASISGDSFDENPEAANRGSAICAYITTLEGAEKFTDADTEYLLSLKSYRLKNRFEEELREISSQTGITYTVVYVNSGRAKVSAVLENAQKIFGFCMYSMLTLGALILSLTVILNIIERRYEIGVLLSIGMSKQRIYVLFTTEILLFTLCITAVGLLAGFCLLPSLGSMLTYTIMQDSLKPLGGIVAAIMFASAAALSIVTSTICAITIMCYPPMDILRSRS